MNFTPQSAIQRIQVGLIGLIAVLLFVSIANVVFDRSAADNGRSEQTAASPGQNAANTGQSRDEPLAELGVAPTVTEQPADAKNAPVNPQ